MSLYAQLLSSAPPSLRRQRDRCGTIYQDTAVHPRPGHVDLPHCTGRGMPARADAIVVRGFILSLAGSLPRLSFHFAGRIRKHGGARPNLRQHASPCLLCPPSDVHSYIRVCVYLYMCFFWLVGNAARQPLEASGIEGVTFPSLPDCPCCSTPTMEDELSQFGMCSQCKVTASSRCCTRCVRGAPL